jgi:group I intron endonuclease
MLRDVLPSTPGIYAIVNLANQHFYVGSAKNLLARERHHSRDLAKGKHKNAHLQRAYDFSGPDSFCFTILEHVERMEDLLAREQHYIDTLNPDYNISRTAGSNLGMKFTPEHRTRISDARRANERMPEQMA